MSVADDFKSLCGNLAVKNRDSIADRAKRITRQLNLEFWGVDSDDSHRLYSGSYGRGTAIHSISDVDLIVWLPYKTYKQYDEYVNQRIQQQKPEPEPEPEVVYIQKPVKERKKKIIYKEVEEEEDEEIVYVQKPKPKPETLDRTLYKSSTEQLHLRAVEERIRHNLAGWHGALMPREY
jgi:hypothetical protein